MNTDGKPGHPPQASTERRRSKRISLQNGKVCVETPDGHQDVAELLNVSRGGLCFRSELIYSVGLVIRIAAPYTPGSTNVFVPARIVRASRDNWGREYGVEYVSL